VLASVCLLYTNELSYPQCQVNRKKAQGSGKGTRLAARRARQGPRASAATLTAPSSWPWQPRRTPSRPASAPACPALPPWKMLCSFGGAVYFSARRKHLTTCKQSTRYLRSDLHVPPRRITGECDGRAALLGVAAVHLVLGEAQRVDALDPPCLFHSVVVWKTTEDRRERRRGPQNSEMHADSARRTQNSEMHHARAVHGAPEAPMTVPDSMCITAPLLRSAFFSRNLRQPTHQRCAMRHRPVGFLRSSAHWGALGL